MDTGHVTSLTWLVLVYGRPGLGFKAANLPKMFSCRDPMPRERIPPLVIWMHEVPGFSVIDTQASRPSSPLRMRHNLVLSTWLISHDVSNRFASGVFLLIFFFHSDLFFLG
jgi:hypothetical protein